MVSDEIAGLVKRTAGLDTAMHGSLAVERVLRERCSAAGLPDAHDYCERLRTSDVELQALIEAIVVSETWFFRDRESFAELARGVVAQCRTHSEAPLRLLSLPCSTGEEPFSMAMALFDAAVASNRFAIDAIDISDRALALARHATYGKNSFRGSDLAYRTRHFHATPDGYRVNDAVRGTVRFARGNLLAADFMPPTAQYDVIYCRNLLIYFDRPTQARAVAILRHLLKPGGKVFVGPAEAGLLLGHEWKWTKAPLAFAFEKSSAPRIEQGRPPAPALPRARSFALEPVATSRRLAVPTTVPETLPAVPSIDEAARFADLGRFAEAAEACEAHVDAHGPSARALHVLGSISSARGAFDKAAQYFRQALYLDPNDGEAALHLALLLEKRGDAAGAKLLRGRARRAARAAN